jgi:hypothetical protein
VPRAYRSVRDHVDDILAYARCVLSTQRAPSGDELGRLEIEVAMRLEQMTDSLALARAHGTPLPLDRLAHAFELEPAEQRVLYLLLALAVSEDLRTLTNRDTATLDLLDRLIYKPLELRDRFAAHLAEDGRLLGYGLVVHVDEPGRSRFSRPVRISDRVIELALGRDVPALGGYASLADARDHDLLLAPEHRELAAAALATHVATGTGPIPILRGAEGSGRRALVESIARAMGRRVLVVQCAALPDALGGPLTAIMREAILGNAIVVLAGAEHLAADPHTNRPDRSSAADLAFAHHRGPVAITLAPGASPAPLTAHRGALVIDLPSPDERDRASLWARVLPGSLAADAAARYRLTGGQIERAARTVKNRSATATLDDVHGAVRAIVDDKLTTLGTRITWKQTWADLVLPPESRAELDEMVARVRHRRRVVDDWGFGNKIAKGLGVAALFSGPPGTGKTMAAGLVAADLGLDLYQIELSRMVSKYIGETEKNLAQVFDAAETGHAILLFDEADAMFTKRTEVRSSNDRYANLEVNYLLQRMEAFTGITILTTNHDAGIDGAFLRRLAFRIAFPMPEEDEREKLWRAIIPQRALGGDIDFALLAERFVMSGGYIKNAALRAAYLAAQAGGLIEMAHLVRAAVSEYTAMGKIMAADTPHLPRTSTL